MKTKTYSLLALAVWLLVSAMFQSVHGQENAKAPLSSSVAERTLQYFKKTAKGDLEDYVRSISFVTRKGETGKICQVLSQKKKRIKLGATRRTGAGRHYI